MLARLSLLAPVAALCLLGASCATVPPPAEPARWLEVLPPDAAVYAVIDVPAARSLLEGFAEQAGLEGRQVGDVLARTRRAWLAVSELPAPAGPSPAVGEGQSLGNPGAGALDLVAIGDFAPIALDLRLSFDRHWRKHVLASREALEAAAAAPAASAAGPAAGPVPWVPERTYWSRADGPFELACPRSGVVLLSTRSAAMLLWRLSGTQGTPGVGLSPAARSDLEQAALFLYLPELPKAGELEGLSRLPIGSVWLAAQPSEPGYLVSAGFGLEGDVNERAVERLFRLLIPLLLRRAQVDDPVGKLRALSLSVSPTLVRIAGLRLAAEEVSRFLADFLPQAEGSDAGGR